MNTQAIYLHGFNSGFNPEKKSIKQISTIFYKVVGRTTNYLDEQDVERLTNFIKQTISDFNGETIIIGTSLGGFFARYFANQFKLRCILINPAVDPHYSIKRAIGKNTNYFTKEVYEITESAVEKLQLYSTVLHSDCLMILATDDDVVPYELPLSKYGQNSKVVLTCGGHRMECINNILPEIDGFCNRIPIK